MRKFILSATVSFAFFLFIIFQLSQKPSSVIASSSIPKTIADSTTTSPATSTQTNNPTTTTPAPTPTPTPSPTPTPTPVPVPVQTGKYKNGQYTGSVTDAQYGLVQVQVSIQNGRIADVQFLQYPNDRQTSQYINSQAMPLLTQEAIQAQSANVDTVSGASDTSQAFRESLSVALQQAAI